MSASHRAPAGDEPATPTVPPFWHRLNQFFLFPFQMEPLIFAVLLALASYLLFLPLIAKIFVFLGIVLGASRYAFKVAALASRGIVHSRDYTASVVDEDWKVLPWKFFAVLLVHGLVIGFLGRNSEALGWVANALSSLVLPATLMVLIQSFSLRAALNPFELLATMTGIGAQYLLLCLFLFLLLMGFPQALQLLLPITPPWLLLPVGVFTAVYFLWVMASLIGYVMFQHHGALDIDLLKDPEPDANAPLAPVRSEAQIRDAAISELVQKGDQAEALSQAREWARVGHDSLDDQRRYHRTLLLARQPQTLAEHAQRFLALLLAHKRGNEALEVQQAVTAQVPDFAAGRADVALGIAEHAWKLNDANTTLAMLRGFDRRFPGHETIPRAYELIVRVLKQGLSRPDKAMPVYQTLQRRYPDHPSTQEAAWVLREELRAQD